jgi:hypothetical protein
MSHRQVRYNPFCLQKGLFFYMNAGLFVEFHLHCVEKNTQATTTSLHFKVVSRWPVSCTSLLKMKTIGIVLIVLGLGMLIFRGFSVQTEKKVVDLGPLEVNKKENKWIGWPVYAGGIAIIAGIILVATDRKK